MSNLNGTLTIYKLFTYNLDSQPQTVQYRILNLQIRPSSILINDDSIQDITGVGQNSLIGALKNEGNRTTQLTIRDGTDLRKDE